MKKRTRLLPLAVLTLMIACIEPLNITEINNLEKIPFEPLMLEPSDELTDLRIDIIRQTYREQVNDSTTETKDVPYHPLGFDLGNGLFFDLNRNLCLRLDGLMGFQGKESWGIECSREGRVSSGYDYTFNNDTLRKDYVSLFGPAHYEKYIRRLEDSLAFHSGKYHRFSIWEDDSAVYYGNTKRIWDEIRMDFEGSYHVPHRRWKDTYLLTGQEVILNNDYRVARNEDGTCIEIWRIWKDKESLMYTMIRDGRFIYVYNERYYGLKLELTENSLQYVRNRYPVCRWDRIW